MMRINRYIRLSVVFIGLILSVIGCINRDKADKVVVPKDYRFEYVQLPMYVSQEEGVAYMREHYWDNFDFTDTLYATRADWDDMLQAYAIYLSNFVDPADPSPISALMHKASQSRVMFDYFVKLSKRLLNHPNSPLRNDEWYMAVLQAQVASPLYGELEKEKPRFNLHVVSQNRINHKANDFYYTLASGKSYNLYSIKADYTILYFNNPDCPLCRKITAALKSSPEINRLQQEGRLKILALYPEEELDEWYEHLDEFPSCWINGYDKGCHIDNERLYNLQAIPSLYLLDRDKRVLVKDGSSVKELEAALPQS